MRKHVTGDYIENMIFNLVKDSPLHKAVSGGIYYYGTRPHGSRKEDIVIKFVTGFDYQIATGSFQISVYIPDIDIGAPRWVKDVKRCLELSAIASEFVHSLNDNSEDFIFELMQSIDTKRDEEAAQHFVRIRLQYRYFNIE